MNDTQRPFACMIEGCEKTFTNEDHLDWHQKKHDMVLNLGLANKSADSVSDQTPTPTRFIRNCEEVGLFQDLQNVNPFEETFKKAIEYAKSGTLHVPQHSNDDTLHTPHIFPPVDENIIINRSDSHSRQSSDFSIITVPSIQNDNESGNVPNAIVDLTDEDAPASESTSPPAAMIDLKDKLKKAIQNKEKNAQKPLVITPVPLERLLSTENNVKQITKKNKYPVDNDVQSEEKEKVREMNRAAQMRCRKRKQQHWKKIEEDLKSVKADNAKLQTENLVLKQKMTILKSIILKYKKSRKPDSLITELEKAFSATIQVVKKPKVPEKSGSANPTEIANSPKRIAPIAPNVQVPRSNPVIIQVLGAVSSQLMPP